MRKATTYSGCRECNHRDWNRIHPLAFAVHMNHERPLPFVFFVETLAKRLKDGVCEEIALLKG